MSPRRLRPIRLLWLFGGIRQTPDPLGGLGNLERRRTKALKMRFGSAWLRQWNCHPGIFPVSSITCDAQCFWVFSAGLAAPPPLNVFLSMLFMVRSSLDRETKDKA